MLSWELDLCLVLDNAATNFYFQLVFFPLLFIFFFSFNLNILTFFLKAV